MTAEREALSVARWVTKASAAALTRPGFMLDCDEMPARLSNIGVVQQSAGLAQARARLAAGARQVLLADAALRDISLIGSTVAEFGAERVGAWLPARRMAVSWALDSQSNGDFKCMVPSNPQVRWEVLTSEQRSTGIEVGGWIEKLARMGVRTMVISVDMQDERDLDICAGMVERFGIRLWFSTLADPDADVAGWVEFGQVRRLVLPDSATADALAARLEARFGSPRAARELVA